ncbi:MAG TPA: XRE family transcriptional regulator [Bradyrhizobium sp.]|nr:XRE family transcriptional regulator [Bradyrhizobium sp.]
MPEVKPDILRWARETAGLSLGRAAAAIGLKDTRKGRAVDRLAALENGRETPSRALISKMAEKYHRPLVAFYLDAPPAKGDRGEDFRSTPDKQTGSEALVDALLRDVRARQEVIRDLLLEDEDNEPLTFISSMKASDGIEVVLASIKTTLKLDLSEYRRQASPEKAFALLRSQAEAMGIFVLLLGNLGSHHTAIDVEAFRGFALADPVAPFVVINDQDSAAAWSFTLLHELAHLWLGQSGVSGRSPDLRIEQFCNDVAASFLLPVHELASVGVSQRTTINAAVDLIGRFADENNVSRTMVAYRLYRASLLTEDAWRALTGIFLANWRRGRDAKRERDKDKDGPNYYVVRRHRLGNALIQTVSRALDNGALTPTRAGSILGVKPRSVASLLNPMSGNRAA